MDMQLAWLHCQQNLCTTKMRTWRHCQQNLHTMDMQLAWRHCRQAEVQPVGTAVDLQLPELLWPSAVGLRPGWCLPSRL
jgi:hypothetical protein